MEKLISTLRVPYRNCCAVTKLMALFFSLSISASALSTNYYVNDNSTVGDVFCTAVGNNANDGLTPSAPMATLTQVWTNYSASLGSTDTVFIDAGTYYQTERDLNITAAFVIQGAGTELTVFDNDETGTTGYTFMRINAALKLNDFKIYRYGRSGTYAHAIHVHSGVTGVELNKIQIDDSGTLGGLYPIEIESGASVTLNGGGLTCNNNWNSSGGIRIVGATSSLTINDYTFYGNSRATPLDYGVCLRQEGGEVSINKSLFENNQVDLSSLRGIIFQSAGSLSIEDCLFDNNTINSPTAATEYGGVIAVEGGDFYIRRSRITNSLRIGGAGNIAGGAIGITDFSSSVSAFIDSCYFEGNNGSTDRATDIFADGNVTITVFDTHFLSASDQVGTRTGGTINLSHCGDPDVYTNFSGSDITNKINTLSPRYTANPILDLYTGDCATRVILPVELTSFSGTCVNQERIIIWQTASEKNNDYFILERAGADLVFEEIAVIDGQGTTQAKSNYEFIDPVKLMDDIVYYQLKQVDFDGKSETFDIISIQNDCFEEEGLRAYYDQQTGRIRLFHAVEARDIVSLSVYAISGQSIPVSFEQMNKNSGYSEIAPFTEFAKGIYIITLQTANEVKTAKISIQ